MGRSASYFIYAPCDGDMMVSVANIRRIVLNAPFQVEAINHTYFFYFTSLLVI